MSPDLQRSTLRTSCSVRLLRFAVRDLEGEFRLFAAIKCMLAGPASLLPHRHPNFSI